MMSVAGMICLIHQQWEMRTTQICKTHSASLISSQAKASKSRLRNLRLYHKELRRKWGKSISSSQLSSQPHLSNSAWRNPKMKLRTCLKAEFSKKILPLSPLRKQQLHHKGSIRGHIIPGSSQPLIQPEVRVQRRCLIFQRWQEVLPQAIILRDQEWLNDNRNSLLKIMIRITIRDSKEFSNTIDCHIYFDSKRFYYSFLFKK